MTNYSFIERASAPSDPVARLSYVPGANDLRIDLPTGALPKGVRKPLQRFEAAVRVRAADVARVADAETAFNDAQIRGANLDIEEVMKDPDAAAARNLTDEPSPGEALLEAAEKELKKARRALEASKGAVPMNYGELISAVTSARAEWTASLKDEAEKAVVELATLARNVEVVAAKLDSSLGLLGMFSKMDEDEIEGRTPSVAVQRGPHSAALDAAIANLGATIGRAQTTLREV